jgi:peroxiredoxin
MLSSGRQSPEFGLEQLRRLGGGQPAVLAFFKASCPVCQLSFPFLDRIAAAGSLPIVGVSQDNSKTTQEFKSEFQVKHIETVLDRPPYAASNAFRITSVPSLFVIEPDGMISKTIEGFSKADFEDLGRRAGVEVFNASDRVPSFRPG